MLVGNTEPSITDRLATWWCRPRLSTTPRLGFWLIAQPPIRCAVNKVARNFFSASSGMPFLASAQLVKLTASRCATRTAFAPAANCSSTMLSQARRAPSHT